MSASEHRAGQRRRMLKQAQIVTNTGHSTLDCLVRDMSLGGARLKVENGLAVPASFELRLVTEDTCVQVQVVWRKSNEVGVRFAKLVDKAA